MLSTETIAVVSLVLSIVGIGIGVFNAWRTYDRDRVNIRVEPVHITFPNQDGPGLKIINRSFFAITINEVGLTTPSERAKFASVGALIVGKGTEGSAQLPTLMEPRTSITILWHFTEDERKSMTKAGVEYAYVRTDCDRTFFGTSEYLRAIFKP
jgi:hypothetical protein